LQAGTRHRNGVAGPSDLVTGTSGTSRHSPRRGSSGRSTGAPPAGASRARRTPPRFPKRNAKRKNRLPGGRRPPRIRALDQRLTVRSLRGARSSRWRTGRPGRAGERGIRDRGATVRACCSPSRRSPPLSRYLPAGSLRAARRTRQGLFSERNSASRLWAAGRIRPSPSSRPSSRPSASSCSTARPVASLP
jgi:hypothetical protein